MSQTPEMKMKEARAAILREWFALAPDQRATPSQASMFADRAMEAHGLPADSVAMAAIRSCLARYTGLNPIF